MRSLDPDQNMSLSRVVREQVGWRAEWLQIKVLDKYISYLMVKLTVAVLSFCPRYSWWDLCQIRYLYFYLDSDI